MIIHLHSMRPVCIVCGKPVELTDDDDWQHASTGDGIACTVYPVRMTTNYRGAV